MRVIAGTYRSRRLAAPRGSATRPSSDRLRETLFNVLAPRIEGAVLADLFAGSGAVGIEAISRGAQQVYFVEKAAPAVAAIRENLKALGIQSGFKIEPCSVAAALPRIAGCTIMYLDPPYDESEEYARTLDSIDTQLTAEGIVVAEHRRKTALAENYGVLHRYRVLEQGDAALSFYRR
jgi:16S rRNA (guanine(966)-N(2))-methyltransferase RsmD